MESTQRDRAEDAALAVLDTATGEGDETTRRRLAIAMAAALVGAVWDGHGGEDTPLARAAIALQDAEAEEDGTAAE